MRVHRLLTVRRTAALSVAALSIAAIVSGLRDDPHAQPVIGRLAPADLPSALHALLVLTGLTLLALTPQLWGGTRAAVSLAVAGLLALAALTVAEGHVGEAVLEGCLTVMLIMGRGAFPLGCSWRPRRAAVAAAIAAWGLAYCTLRLAPLVRGGAGHAIVRALHHSVAHALSVSSAARLSGRWTTVIEVLVGGAVVISVLALRSLLRPASAANGHTEPEDAAAHQIVDRHGHDSLSPFLVRPDKALAFAAGGVLSYRVIGGTAVVSADPAAPDGAAAAVVSSFLLQARRRGWKVVLWGVSDRHLADYRGLGLHAVRAGEEAFVDPREFSLEGRRVRKLRQSVHRVQRRGWEITVHEGRHIGAGLEAEMDVLEAAWRRGRRHLHGFAMGLGAFAGPLLPDDLYVLARSPAGELGAAMRFVSHCGNLSLDTMRRVGETPNGLNEALMARALEVARERGIGEVSLNYAGLGHLVRREPSANRVTRALTRLAMTPLHRRFQMDRLVRFNDKFTPEWRPRYLVCESRGALPRAIVRVLQAEGYLPERRPLALPAARRALPRGVPARLRPRAPVSEP